MGLPKGARIAPITNAWNGSTLKLRNQLWGKWKLRPGLPDLRSPDLTPEVAWYSAMLDQGLPCTTPTFDTVWDIGCRNWSYMPAWLRRYPAARLHGVEVDAGRRYWNLYRRHDLATAYQQWGRDRGHQVELFFSDFRRVHLSQNLEGTQNALFAFFFPFVSIDPCLSWGLPAEFASFDRLIRYSLASSLLVDTVPHWLSIHQGEWELELARNSLQSFGFQLRETKLEIPGWPSPHPVFAIYSEQGQSSFDGLKAHP